MSDKFLTACRIENIPVHTFTLAFLLLLDSWNMENLFRWFLIIQGLKESHDRCSEGIKLKHLYIRPNEERIFSGIEIQLRIDCVDFFGDAASSPAQIAAIRKAITDILAPMHLSVPDMKVKSIDFCKNFYVEDPNLRELLLELWDKTHEWFKRAKRIPAELCGTKNKLYWDCNNSYNVQLYDKETELRDKGEDIESYECGLMRLEYQIREDHIDYWAKNGRPSDFDTWADWYLRARYLAETEMLFFNGDFYSLPRVKTKLNKAVRAGTIKPVIADRIYQFMVDTSRHGIDYAFSQTSQPTAQKYIDILSRLRINPIPIPRNRGVSFLENPLWDFYVGGCMD